jgi:biopolymer transport protein ExbD
MKEDTKEWIEVIGFIVVMFALVIIVTYVL